MKIHNAGMVASFTNLWGMESIRATLLAAKL